ncbi:Tn3 family transposase [Chryseobacterium fistulae]|uniref:Tn3 family transposase n=1 Tax=Chryseobacterium fistulae TaxID=2675058 RepID=A0A6N4XN89_9FLAO|nr:Tn3 family transposase [Chryseobacterium fistulae]CAA7386633.1 hypothetical protein CHRY9393_00930 [Chryseobacterium fistulae]
MKAEILSKSQQNEFDRPPKLNLIEKRLSFELPGILKKYTRQLESSSSLVGFIIQYGYFRNSGKFYPVSKFIEEDIDAICRWNTIDSNIKWENYKTVIIYRHRKIIREYFGFYPFNTVQRDKVLTEANRLLRKEKRLDAIFLILTDYIREHRIETPTYHALAGIVQSAMKMLNNEYISVIDTFLTENTKYMLDRLLEKEEKYPIYNLTRLKTPAEKLSLRNIRDNISDYRYFKELFQELQSIIRHFDFSMEIIEYYALFVIRSQVFQISRRSNRYLMLICFIIYQYYYLGDILLLTLISSVRKHENEVDNKVDEILIKQQESSQEDLEKVFFLSEKMSAHIEELIKVRENPELSHKNKLLYYEKFAQEGFVDQYLQIVYPLRKLKKNNIKKIDLYYQELEGISQKLMNKTSEILKVMDFEISDPFLKEAIMEFKRKDGNITEAFPGSFLNKEEKKYFKKRKPTPKLLKSLLLGHLTHGVKSGEVSLIHSFQHQPFDNYLINKEYWNKHKNEIIGNSSLSKNADWDVVFELFQSSLQEAFQNTFESINNPKNPYITPSSKGSFPSFNTPAKPKNDLSDIKLMFPSTGSIALLEILNTINQSTSFTKDFTHWSGKSLPKRPHDMEFFALIMAYGCNLGLGNMVKNTTNINAESLNNTANWYFSTENIQTAIDTVVEFTGKLKIVDFLKNKQPIFHTSSDGQKFYIKNDSIHADYAYKYFGKSQGIVMHSSVDFLHRLFFPVIHSPSERESIYSLDGAVHYDIVQTEMHSTDTHGASEAVFALSFLSDIILAPRIADFEKSVLFFPQGVAPPKLENHVLNIRKLKTDHIEDHWDQILRIAASIRLRHTKPSVLLKRLTSYARQNSLYQALRDLGRLVRTKFLLDYMYDHNLRQMIQEQLNKGENVHQLARRIFYGNNGKLQASSKEEYLQATACKALIHNLIVCWNYMYMSKKLTQAKQNERKKVFEKIEQMYPVRWEHINFYGIFDFSEESLKDSLEFNTEDLFDFEIE